MVHFLGVQVLLTSLLTSSWWHHLDDIICLHHHIFKNYIFAPNAKIFAFMPSKCHVGRPFACFPRKWHHLDDLMCLPHAYIIIFSKITFWPLRTKSLQFHPYMWPATIPLLEAKFPCLPHHDDIILMTSCAYITIFQKLHFCPQKVKSLHFSPPHGRPSLCKVAIIYISFHHFSLIKNDVIILKWGDIIIRSCLAFSLKCSPFLYQHRYFQYCVH